MCGLPLGLVPNPTSTGESGNETNERRLSNIVANVLYCTATVLSISLAKASVHRDGGGRGTKASRMPCLATSSLHLCLPWGEWHVWIADPRPLPPAPKSVHHLFLLPVTSCLRFSSCVHFCSSHHTPLGYCALLVLLCLYGGVLALLTLPVILMMSL